MNDFWMTARNMSWNLTHRLGFADVVDILIVAAILYEVMILMRRTRSSALIKGVVILLVVVAGSSLLGLTSLNWLLTTILRNGVIVLLILFQPEIRKALEKVGRSTLLSRGKRMAGGQDDQKRIIREVIQTATDLSKRKVGALICFERMTGLQEVIETGTRIDGDISAPLLENIFEPNTPLHDGAVVIRGDKIAAAACILPLTEASGVSRELGTRHRAGIGLSENSDAEIIIVSEETGTISMARGGQLFRPLQEEELRMILEEIYNGEPSRLSTFFRSLIKDRRTA